MFDETPNFLNRYDTRRDVGMSRVKGHARRLGFFARLLATSAAAVLMMPVLLGGARCYAQEYVAPDDSREGPLPSSLPDESESPMTLPRDENRDAGFAALLSGQTAPLALKLSDLKSGWRRMTLNSLSTPQDRPPGSPPPPRGQVDFEREWFDMIGAAPGVYFTRGQTVSSGGDSFLAVYRVRYSDRDLNALFPRREKPTAAFTTRATQILTNFMRRLPLDMSLINLKTVNNISDIRPFDIEKQAGALKLLVANAMKQMAARESNYQSSAQASARTTGRIAVSLSNLRQIGLGLIQYTQDYDDVLPLMTSAATAKKALLPYVKDAALFARPGSNTPYLPNPILSRKKRAHIANPARMVAFYEDKPGADGLRAVLFLDGHSKRLSDKDWRLFKRGSKIK